MRYEIRADIEKNRLYMVLDGFFSDAQMKEAADKVIEEIDKLQPGFDIINDISAFLPASEEGVRQIARGQQHAKAKGVRRIVRVTNESVISALQFNQTGHKTYDQPISSLATTMEDAEKILADDK